MYVVYLNKKKMLTIITTVVIILLLLSTWWILWRQINVPTTAEPYYQGQDNKKQIAFTFNVDWGQDYLSDMLKTLDENDVKATFFLTGRWAKKCPDYAKKIVDGGHEIGNHGLEHKSPNQMNEQENRQDIKTAEKYILDVIGIKTELFAPASGERNTQVLKAADGLGYKTILWSIDTIDWRKDKTPDQIINKVISKAHNGAIVLMHPTEATTLALPGLIKALKDKGYEIVPVSKILP